MNLRLPIALLALTAFSHAAETNYVAGQSAAAWLKIGTDARTAAMGGAGSMTSQDVNAAKANPANLAGMQGKQLGLMHDALLDDLSLEHLAAGMGVSEKVAFAVGVDYMNYGSVDTYTISGNTLAQGAAQTPNAYNVGASFGYALMDGVGIGANLKYLAESLPGNSSNGYALDLGARYQMKDLSLGLAVQNVAGQLGSAVVAPQLGLGAGYGMPVGGSLDLNVALDLNSEFADFGGYRAGLGAELNYDKNYALRVGYAVAGNNGLGGLSAGAGLTWSILRVDYAFVMQNDLGASNQLSILTKF